MILSERHSLSQLQPQLLRYVHTYIRYEIQEMLAAKAHPNLQLYNTSIL